MSGSSQAAPGVDQPIPRSELIHIRPWKRLASAGLYLAAILLRRRNRSTLPNSRRVLVLEPVGLGDMVGFNPLVRELLERKFEVVLCSKPEWRALYPDRPGQTWLNLRLPWTSHNETMKYQAGLYFRDPTRGDLRAMRAIGTGAVGLDTRGDIRSVLLLYWAGCRRVISLSNYLGSDLKMWPAAAEIVPFDNSLRRWELNARFLQCLDPAADPATVRPPSLDHLVARSAGRKVGLMPVAPWAGKLWPRERWEAVCTQLRSRHWELTGLCGPGQTGRAREQLGSGVKLVECDSIHAWAREFNRCAFVISVDSGPMHLADAMGVPVVALFGQGKLPLWAPSHPKSVALARRDRDFFVCHPIDANTALGQKYMNRITVADVLTAAGSLAVEPAPDPKPLTPKPFG